MAGGNVSERSGAPALRAQQISKRYGTVLALDNVSLDVWSGECVALIGESGSGKTTLLRCFNRLIDPDAGRVLVEGADAAALDPIALRRRVGYVPQDGGLLPHWRVRRNVALVPWLRGADQRARAGRAGAAARGTRPRGVSPTAGLASSPAGSGSGSPWRARWPQTRHRPARRAVRRARRDHSRRSAGHFRPAPPRARRHHAARHPRPARGVRCWPTGSR